MRVNRKIETLPIPSDEQREILNYFKQGFNCKVDALAGAGKSTTLLLLAQEAKKSFNARTLIITYNKHLKDELSGKIRELNLNSHCEAYTYHGYASRIYHNSIHNDKLLRERLNSHQIPQVTEHSIILLDEVQDMNQDYYQLITKILSHGKMLVIVGDKRQCINQYIGATAEYLINYNKYFDTGRPWKELTLRTSYRLTPSITTFVNTNILCENLIISGNTKNKDLKPIYSYGAWDIKRFVVSNVETYGANEVVLMLPSVRNINPKSPVGRLCSQRQPGILFCINDNDLDHDTMKGKVLITSYNSMKGRERKCVILIGFDESYFEYYDKKWDKSEKTLPNILYVAATRSCEQLIIIQDDTKPFLRTMTISNLYNTCDIRGGLGEKPNTLKDTDNNSTTYSITDLTRHRNTTDTLDMLSLLEISTLQPPLDPLSYQNIIQFNGYYEDMRQYYGTLIPLLAEHRKTKTIHLTPFNIGTQNNKKLDISIIQKYNSLLENPDKTIQQWMELVVLYSSIITNCYFYAYQITNYDWVDSKFINLQVDRILNVITTFPSGKPDGGKGSGSFEYPCSFSNLQGYFDFFNDTDIWEFKCSSTISDDHKMQCGAYVSMFYLNTGISLPCKLFNTRTCELLNIILTDPVKYLDILVRSKKNIPTSEHIPTND